MFGKIAYLKKKNCFSDFSQLVLMINVQENPINNKSIESVLKFQVE